MSVEIVFEAHATTVDNERRIATGWLDGELSELGKTQARELGERSVGVDAVYVSDLGRAIDTAKIAFGEADVVVRTDARLRECNYGEMNGVSVDVIDSERLNRIDVPFPGGESYRQCAERMGELLDELKTSFDGRRVVLIGHRATFYALEHLVEGTSLEELIASPLPPWEPGRRYVLE